MPDKAAQLATRYARTHEAARILGISPRTLEKYRSHGSGPTFRKLGGRVVYAIDDLEAWADQAAGLDVRSPVRRGPRRRPRPSLRRAHRCHRAASSPLVSEVSSNHLSSPPAMPAHAISAT